MNQVNNIEYLFQEYADVVTVPELAKMLRIGRNSAYDLVNGKRIQSVKVGSQIRIPKSSIIEFIKMDIKIGGI
jgi:excisionase family DNA binding protein